MTYVHAHKGITCDVRPVHTLIDSNMCVWAQRTRKSDRGTTTIHNANISKLMKIHIHTGYFRYLDTP
jgi:hypothetical protein